MYPYFGQAQPMSWQAYQAPQQMIYQPQAQNVLPQQQILQANGKDSINAVRMAPNSSVYIEDTTVQNLVWKCVSDSLGQVTAKPFDLTPHEEAPIIDNNGLLAIVGQMNDRLTKLEGIANAWESIKSTADTSDSSTSAKAVSSAKPSTSRNATPNGSQS